MKLIEKKSYMAYTMQYYNSMKRSNKKLNQNSLKGDTMEILNNSFVKFVVVTGLIFKVSLFIFSLV